MSPDTQQGSLFIVIEGLDGAEEPHSVVSYSLGSNVKVLLLYRPTNLLSYLLVSSSATSCRTRTATWVMRSSHIYLLPIDKTT